MDSIRLLNELEDFIKVSYPVDISERCGNKTLELISEIKDKITYLKPTPPAPKTQ